MNIFEDLISGHDVSSWNKRTMSIIREEGYYVYKHYLDGKLFYIGKGRGLRCFEFKNRGSAWKNYVDGREDEVLVDIVRYFDSENAAFNFESNEIVLNKDKYLVNIMHNHIKNLKVDLADTEKNVLKMDYLNKDVIPTYIIYGNGLHDLDLNLLSIFQMKTLMAIVSQVRKDSLKDGCLVVQMPFKNIRLLLDNYNLDSTQIKKRLDVFKSLGFLIYELVGKKEIEIRFSRKFTEKFLSNEKGYNALDFKEYMSFKKTFSSILYLFICENRMKGEFIIDKKYFVSLMNPPASYDEYESLRKIVLPALDDNKEFFPNLAFSNLNGNSIPEVCKFSFFRKRTTKMEKDLKKADSGNILELIEKYKS